MNADTEVRLSDLKDEVRDLRQVIFGNEGSLGLFTRMKVLETRLQIFWWCLAVAGSTVIALTIQLAFSHVKTQ